jgi:hypothetical protein
VSPNREVLSPVLRRILAAGSPREISALTEIYHIDLTAPTDDRPFFFNQLLLADWTSIKAAQTAPDGVIRGNLAATRTVGMIIIISAIFAFATMIIPSLRSVRRTELSLGSLGTLYFALIGLGFMFIEIGLIQRVSLFLGHPVYGLAIGLFSVILSTGIGSLVSERLRLDTSSRLALWAVSLCLLVILLSVCFSALVAAFEGKALIIRVVLALTVIVPAGLLMGFGFPTGMRMVNAVDSRPTPWFWAVNGSASVLAASIAVATSIAFSINASLWIGAVCYLLLAPIGIALFRMGRSLRAAGSASETFSPTLGGRAGTLKVGHLVRGHYKDGKG